jgi:hypothetical protein
LESLKTKQDAREKGTVTWVMDLGTEMQKQTDKNRRVKNMKAHKLKLSLQTPWNHEGVKI